MAKEKIDYTFEIKNKKAQTEDFFFWDTTLFGFYNVVKWLTGIDILDSINKEIKYLPKNWKLKTKLEKYIQSKKALKDVNKVIELLEEIQSNPEINHWVLNTKRNKGDFVFDINLYLNVAYEWKEFVKKANRKGKYIEVKKQ